MNVELTTEEAEWLQSVLGLVMRLSRKWDDLTGTDHGNRIQAKLTMARINNPVGEQSEPQIGFIDSYGQARISGHPTRP